VSITNRCNGSVSSYSIASGNAIGSRVAKISVRIRSPSVMRENLSYPENHSEILIVRFLRCLLIELKFNFKERVFLCCVGFGLEHGPRYKSVQEVFSSKFIC